MLRLRSCLAALAISFAAVACGGDSGGGGGSDVFTLELIETGEYTISGTVTLPAETASDHAVQLMVMAVDPPTGAYAVIQGVGFTDGEDSFRYRVVGPNDGVSYRVRAAVDLDDSEELDSGDLMGWYDGTVAAPIQTTSSATLLTISGASISDADFGLGPVP